MGRPRELLACGGRSGYPLPDMIADIIPETCFQSLVPDRLWCLWLIAAGAIVLLVVGADRVVAAAVRLARSIGMSTIIIGATVVSLGTTSPEAFVSVTAAFKGSPGLALGNGIGSVICDTALVFGLCCCIARLPRDRYVLSRHGWIQPGAALLLVIMVGVPALVGGSIEGNYLPRWCGFVLVGCLVAYMIMSVHWARKNPDDAYIKEISLAVEADTRLSWKGVVASVAVLLAGLALVIAGSELLVGSVRQICTYYHVPESILAVTLVAFGTSLPELATAIASLVKGHADLLIGNVIGADVLNIFFVIGASASATALRVPGEFYSLHLPVLMVVLLFFRFAGLGRGARFSRWQGGVLLAMFAGYYALLLATASR